MYAIIQASGRQMRVQARRFCHARRHGRRARRGVTLGDVLLVEKDGGEVLAGAPFVANAKVIGRRRRRGARAEDPRVQEEAPQGHAPDQGTPRGLHAASRSRKFWCSNGS